MVGDEGGGGGLMGLGEERSERERERDKKYAAHKASTAGIICLS